MENFDIEKLERKNIYKTPDFFAEMQENVLQKTVYSIQPIEKVENFEPKKSKNWIYSAAASVAVILGVSAFWMNSKSENQQKVEVANYEWTDIKMQPTKEPLPSNSDFEQNSPKTETQTFAASETKKIEAPKPPKIEVPEIQKSDYLISDPIYVSNKDLVQSDIDKIVSILPEKDLAELSSDADADVYLDLYN